MTSCPKCKATTIPDTQGREVCVGCRRIVSEPATGTSSPPTYAGKFSSVNAAKARSTPGAMNSTEKARAEVIELLRQAGEIQGWIPQPFKFELGTGTSYTPDFLIVELDGTITLEEVKGSYGWRLDKTGRVKFKLAAERFPLFRFRGVLLRDDKTWNATDHTPRACWPPVGGGSKP